MKQAHTHSTRSGSPPRSRGTSAGIDRKTIVAAAMQMRPEQLTMQAVANALGVDRKALHHHVGSLEDLRRLVANRLFETRLEQVAPTPVPSNWDTALRAWAEAIRDSCAATGQFVESLRFAEGASDARLKHVDYLLGLLTEAGFDEATAGRILLMVASVASDHARQRLWSQASGTAQAANVHEALRQDAGDGLERVRRLASVASVTHDDHQFSWQVDVILRGLSDQRRDLGAVALEGQGV